MNLRNTRALSDEKKKEREHRPYSKVIMQEDQTKSFRSENDNGKKTMENKQKKD